MKVVTFTDTQFGSMDWELPEDFEKLIDELPPHLRKEMHRQIGVVMQGQIHLLRHILVSPDPHKKMAFYCKSQLGIINQLEKL